jgi:branched-chain amino acid transport system substrate-binding protein
MVSGYAKEAEKAIKIGAIYPLSGSLATTGADIKNGIMLIVDVINHEYELNVPLARSKGIDSLNGAKIEIVFGDSQGSPSTGKSEAERLINKEKVVALIGCYQSAVTAEASQVAEDKGIPFLTALSSAPSLSQRGFNWFFRTTPNEEPFVQNFYEFLQDIRERDIEVDKLAIVHENSIWGSEVGNLEGQYAEEYGYQLVERISYSANTTDVTNEVQRLKNAHPDVVMQASYINDAILCMQTYKQMNFNPDAILADAGGFVEPEFLQVLGEDGNYILTRATWSEDLAETKPLVGTVAQMFRERYGTDMNGNSTRAFTGMFVLADAINRAGSTNPEAIREALLETNIPGDKLIMPWDGVKFDQETHQNTLGKGIICQIIDQGYYTVWPRNFATKELIWPMPKWEEREPELKVAVLYYGFIKDYGWGYEGQLGAEEMAEELPYVGLSEREEACSPDAPQIMREYADTGYKVIFGHGPEFGEYMEEVAPDYPDVIFMWGDGVEKKAPNAGIYFDRMYEGRFLTGMVAGAMTKTDRIGYVAAMPIPEVVRGIDAFAKGVASVNSEAKIYVEWIGEWYDPPREREVALSLIDKGCDVITHHSDSYAPGEAAQEKGVYYISYHSDMRRFAPHVFLTGTVWNWAPIMTDIVKAVREGTWDERPGQDWWYGLAEGGVKLAPFSNLVPDDVREMVEQKKQAIIAGNFEVFPGMTDEELREIYYFESNIVGELK